MNVTVRIKPGVHHGLESIVKQISGGKILVVKEWSENSESSEHFVLFESVDEIVREMKNDFPKSVDHLEDDPLITEKTDHVQVHLFHKDGRSGWCNDYFMIYGLNESERADLIKKLSEVRIEGKLLNWEI